MGMKRTATDASIHADKSETITVDCTNQEIELAEESLPFPALSSSGFLAGHTVIIETQAVPAEDYEVFILYLYGVR